MKKRIGLALLAGMALLMPTAPAQALLSVRYDGTAEYQAYEPYARGPANFPISAIFYYDDVGNQLAATFIAAGIVRSHFTFCPTAGWCPSLAISGTSIGSEVASTPEDGISMFVFSPGGFDGSPLLGSLPRKRIYDLVSADTSSAFGAWTVSNPPDWRWIEITGRVDRVTIAVPEPASWMIMITGFGLTGLFLRRQRLGMAA